MEPEDQELAVELEDQDRAVEPEALDPAVKLEDLDLTVEPEDQNLVVELVDQDLAEEPKDQDLAVEPEDQDREVEPEDQDLVMAWEDLEDRQARLDRMAEWVQMVDSLREVGVQVDPEPRQHIHPAHQVLGLGRSGSNDRPVPAQVAEPAVAVVAMTGGLKVSVLEFVGPMDLSRTPSRSLAAHLALNFPASPDLADRQTGQEDDSQGLEDLELVEDLEE